MCDRNCKYKNGENVGNTVKESVREDCRVILSYEEAMRCRNFHNLRFKRDYGYAGDRCSFQIILINNQKMGSL